MDRLGEPIRVGVAGYGRMGAHHARILGEIPSCACAGVFDPDPKRRSEAARAGVAAFDSLEGLIERSDALTVAAPTSLHHEIARAALAEGRHVLVEKPITPTYEEAEGLVALAREKKLVLSVGHVERFNGAILAARSEVRAPRFVEVHRLSPFPERSLDVGVVLDLMIHDIDIVLSLVRASVDQIDAIGASVLTEKEDIANARLHFSTGAVANLTASRVSVKRMRKIRIFEADRYLSIDYEKQDLVSYSLREGAKKGTARMGDILRKSPKIAKTEPLREELAAFIEEIRGGRGGGVRGEEGADALEVALEIGRKIASGGS